MSASGEWKIFGVISMLTGIVAIFTGKAGLTYYGRADGMGARVAGILMIVLGIGLIFPIKKKKK